MGNTASSNDSVGNSSQTPQNGKNEETQLFDNILNVSKELLSRYNQEFLREDFCFDLAIITENSLDKLSYPVLQDLGNRIQTPGEGETPQMKMILQYSPKDDEKFFIEGFEKQLEDYFWNQSVKMDQSIMNKEGLSMENMNISNVDLFQERNKDKKKFRYIDLAKINELLRDFQNKKSSAPQSEENTNMMGGANNIRNFRRELNKALENTGKKNLSKVPKRRVNVVAGNNNNINLNLLRESLEINKNKNKNKNNTKINVVVENLQKEINKKNLNNRQMNVMNNKTKNGNKELNKKVEKIIEKNILNGNKAEVTATAIPIVSAPQPNNMNKVNNLVKNEMENTVANIVNNKKKNNLTNNKNKKNQKQQQQHQQDIVQYHVKKEYERPTEVCMKGVDKCSLTKKELCKVISENLIVRCNIIAGILTVLPNKKVRGEYVGGYLYNKFINLARCHVCVPYNYKDLMDRSPVDLIKHVVQYSDFLDYKSCKENGGYYMKLSKQEMEALYNNVPQGSNVDLGKQMNYNAFYIQCAEKLKSAYFDNLRLLLEILEQLKSQPVINNVTLNELGLKTRQIIDNMYHLCQYYYIYAIVSLLHANLTITKSKDLVLQKSLARVLQKNKSSNEESNSESSEN